ncbi:MAG: MFS transporter, partial [Euryarchaeota archaeon]|nr:MFS transporter [Euryarchaeota archaeon]
ATYGMLIAFAGAALRGFAWNSLSFTLFTAIYGIGMAVTFTNLPKIAEHEFPAKEQSIASGVYMSGLPLGAIVALVPGSMLGFLTWQEIIFLYSSLFLIALPLWLATARDVPVTPVHGADFVQVSKNRGLWILSVANMTLLITYFGVTTYLPMQKNMQALLGPQTSLLIASVSAALIFGLLLFPHISGRFGERRSAVVYQLCTAGFLILFFAALHFNSPLVWVFSILAGVFLGGTIPLFFAFLTRIGIRSEMFGIASGIFVSVLNIGGFLAPVLAHAIDFNFGLAGVIALFAGASLAGAVLTLLIPFKNER